MSRTEHILVVDDDPLIRDFLRDMLGASGFHVSVAANASQVMAALSNHDVALAVVDVVMPGLDGIRLLQQIRDSSPQTSVVMLTAVHDLKVAIECLTRGADQFLLKPVQVAELDSAIEKALERRRLKLENEQYQRNLERMVEARTRELSLANARLRELDELKSEFVSRVSHELRSPLTVMQTNLAVLLERLSGPITDEQAELLESCQRNIHRLSRLVENVLDLSKMESGRAELQRERLRPGAVIDTVVRYFRPTASERGVDLELEHPGAEGAEVLGDPDKLQQVVTNLVDNALKYTPEGGRVRVLVEDRPDVVWVSVEDTGPGILPEDRDRIFQRFVQGRPPASGRVRGTGLGLAIATGIVEAHGGRFEVESEVGHGSCFAFSIPRIEAEAGRPAAAG